MEGTGCEEMFKHKKTIELKELYTLLKRCPDTVSNITEKMKPYIEHRGEEIIKDQELLKNPVDFTQRLLDLKKEIDEMVSEAFENNIKTQKCRDVAFQTFMNKCQYTPHFMAGYCDHQFKVGLKGLSEEEVEIQLSAIINLFTCLHARDSFIKSYTVIYIYY